MGIGHMTAQTCADAGSVPLEPLLTAEQVGEHLQVDTSTARRIFLDVPGVVHLGGQRRGKRQYDPIRIPASVLERWIRERAR
jgi:hypothetical protein